MTGVCQAGQSINWYNQTKMKLQITFRAVRGDKLLIEASNIPQPSSVLSTNQNQLKTFCDKRASGGTGERADQGHHHVERENEESKLSLKFENNKYFEPVLQSVNVSPDQDLMFIYTSQCRQ